MKIRFDKYFFYLNYRIRILKTPVNKYYALFRIPASNKDAEFTVDCNTRIGALREAKRLIAAKFSREINKK